MLVCANMPLRDSDTMFECNNPGQVTGVGLIFA
jgi:hypothetical protein